MKRRLAILTALLLLGAYLFGCDSADNPIAPTGSTLTVSASPSQIDLGGSSTISITGFRPDGNPLNPGTQLTITTTIGRIMVRQTNGGLVPGNIVEVGEAGRATAQLEGDGRLGTATVTVALTSGGEGASATTDVRIGLNPEDNPTITLDANPSDVALNGTSTITMTARQADGAPLTTGTVNVRTTLGTLGDSTLQLSTNNGGIVSTTLTSSQSGTATVTASVGSSDDATVEVTFGTTRKPTLELVANPRIVDVLQQSQISISIRDENNNLITSQQTVFLDGNLGTLSTSSTGNFTSSLQVGVSGGRRTVFFQAGNVPGSGGVSGFVGNSETATAAIEIRDAPAAVSLTPNTSIVTRTTESSITLSALVTDSRSNRVSNEIVTFNAIDGSGASLSFDCSETGCSKATGSDGIAEVTITFQANTIPAAITSFTVRASVRGGSPNDTKTITVQ